MSKKLSAHCTTNERISAFDMSEMRAKCFNQKQAECGCLLTFLWIFSLQSVQSHNINKVRLSRYSVVSIDGCPLGTVYFVHHNDWFSMIKILVLRVRHPRWPINIFMSIKLIESHAFQTTEQYPSLQSTLPLSIT